MRQTLKDWWMQALHRAMPSCSAARPRIGWADLMCCRPGQGSLRRWIWIPRWSRAQHWPTPSPGKRLHDPFRMPPYPPSQLACFANARRVCAPIPRFWKPCCNAMPIFRYRTSASCCGKTPSLSGCSKSRERKLWIWTPMSSLACAPCCAVRIS